MQHDTASYKDAYERERKARLRSEEILEDKTREIFYINEQLKKQTEALARSNEELTQFAFIASHDLKEPLRKIKTFSNFLVDEFGSFLPETAKNYLTRMNNAVNRMEALIEGLLHYSRATRNIESFVKIDLNTTVQEVLSDLEGRIQDKQGKIEITNPLPTIEADSMQFHQLFQNLIGNALKFHQKDKPPVITISSKLLNEKNSQPQCEITIADNGIGFEEKYINKIFSIFQRLHAHSEYEGSGIGLAICKKIAERHHGTIIVKSTPNVGTTFIISIPITQGGHVQ